MLKNNRSKTLNYKQQEEEIKRSHEGERKGSPVLLIFPPLKFQFQG